MRKMMLFLVLMFWVVASGSTAASATSAEATQQEEGLGRIMDQILLTQQPNAEEVLELISHSMDNMDCDDEEAFPSYSEFSWDFMRTAYRSMFRFHAGADWLEMMIYSWGVAAWGGWEVGSPQADFAKREELTEIHASGFWSWRKELLRQARLIMDDPQLVKKFYHKYKRTITGLNREHKHFALKKARILLSVLQGTHELSPCLTIIWYSKLRDRAYHDLYEWMWVWYEERGYEVTSEFYEVKEWFYFMERRREVGGNDVIDAYEMIVVDFIETLDSF